MPIQFGYSKPGVYYFNLDLPGNEKGYIVTDALFPGVQKQIKDYRTKGAKEFQKKGDLRTHCCGMVKVDNEYEYGLYTWMLQIANRRGITFDHKRISKAFDMNKSNEEFELEEDLGTFVSFFLKNMKTKTTHGFDVFAAYLDNNGIPTREFFKKFKLSPVGQIALIPTAAQDGRALNAWEFLKRAVDKAGGTPEQPKRGIQDNQLQQDGAARKQVRPEQNPPSPSQQPEPNEVSRVYKVPIFSTDPNYRPILECYHLKNGTTTLCVNGQYLSGLAEVDVVVYCGYVKGEFVVCYRTTRGTYLVKVLWNGNRGVLRSFDDVVAFAFDTGTMQIMAFMDKFSRIDVYDYVSATQAKVIFAQSRYPTVLAVNNMGVITSNGVYLDETKKFTYFVPTDLKRAVAWCASDSKTKKFASININGILTIGDGLFSRFGNIDVSLLFGSPETFSDLWWWKDNVQLPGDNKPSTCHVFAMRTKSFLLVLNANDARSVWFGEAPHPLMYYVGNGTVAGADCMPLTSGIKLQQLPQIPNGNAREMQAVERNQQSNQGTLRPSSPLDQTMTDVEDDDTPTASTRDMSRSLPPRSMKGVNEEQKVPAQGGRRSPPPPGDDHSDESRGRSGRPRMQEHGMLPEPMWRENEEQQVPAQGRQRSQSLVDEHPRMQEHGMPLEPMGGANGKQKVPAQNKSRTPRVQRSASGKLVKALGNGLGYVAEGAGFVAEGTGLAIRGASNAFRRVSEAFNGLIGKKRRGGKSGAKGKAGGKPGLKGKAAAQGPTSSVIRGNRQNSPTPMQVDYGGEADDEHTEKESGDTEEDGEHTEDDGFNLWDST